MTDYIFRAVTREELLTVLTPAQVEVIDRNLETFHDNLRVSMLHDFMGEVQPNGSYWHERRGHVFLHVIDDHKDWTRDLYRYATDLGFYEDCGATISLIQQYIFSEQVKRTAKDSNRADTQEGKEELPPAEDLL